MSVFQGLIETRDRQKVAVEEILGAIEAGQVPKKPERERIDCKEEAGRRGHGGTLLPGEPQSTAAANQLAREVPCMANTPDGGVLIYGIEDETWDVLGTELDRDWLRHRIYQLVDIAPEIDEHQLNKGRVLVIYVAEAPEPVEDPDGKLRWRVGDHCEPVDRAEWWRARQARAGLDPMAGATTKTVADARATALAVARDYLKAAADDLAQVASDEELVRQLGLLRSDGALTEAGALLFCEAGRSLITLASFDVVGGNVTGTHDATPSGSLLEQIAEIEARLDVLNKSQPVSRGFVEAPVREIPTRAVREAVLNGVIHRDWHTHRPTEVEWFELDGRLVVTSPGGFPRGISETNILTQREPRYPALSDAFRALRLVDKRGVGVDRMYREMIALGHHPPEIIEINGPKVRCTLQGGKPVLPVLALVGAISPRPRQADVRIALLFFTLLRQPFVTITETARILQGSEDDAEAALLAAGETRVGGEPLVVQHRDVWIFGDGARSVLLAAIKNTTADALGLLPYHKPKRDGARAVIRQWLASHPQIQSGDYARLAGVSVSSASNTLGDLANSGDTVVRGEERTGRNAYFVAPA